VKCSAVALNSATRIFSRLNVLEHNDKVKVYEKLKK